MPVQPAEIAWNEATIRDFREHAGKITEGPLAGSSLLLLTTTGARSGRAQTVPVGYTRDGDRYVIVGSNSGGPTNSAWFHNLKAHPIATVEVGEETFQASATVTVGSERRRLLDAHIAAIPAFGEYEHMTERELPVVTLERIDEGA
ncbi:MAG: nitroreductase/quinone reductase family protein [Solirubrobacterales bacterium]